MEVVLKSDVFGEIAAAFGDVLQKYETLVARFEAPQNGITTLLAIASIWNDAALIANDNVDLITPEEQAKIYEAEAALSRGVVLGDSEGLWEK